MAADSAPPICCLLCCHHCLIDVDVLTVQNPTAATNQLIMAVMP